MKAELIVKFMKRSDKANSPLAGGFVSIQERFYSFLNLEKLP